MASDFAENELDLFRKAVSGEIPSVSFLRETVVFIIRNGNCSVTGSPLLPEKALCRGRCRASASPGKHSRSVIGGEGAVVAWGTGWARLDP